MDKVDSKLKIMYIEDDDDIADLYFDVIQEEFANYKLVRFINAQSAITELRDRHHDYALIISDYRLPDLLGSKIFLYAQERMMTIPFIFMSGYDPSHEPEMENFFFANFKNAIVHKPCTETELLEKIRNCLKK